MTLPTAAQLAPRRDRTPKWWPAFAAGLTLLTLLPLAMELGPLLLRLPNYEVSGGQIEAHSLASRTVIPQGTPVERVTLQKLSRRMGSATPGYTVGRFDSERGELAVYGDGSRTGLLFGTRPPTFLTPTDPDTLLTVWKKGDTGTFRPAPVPLGLNLWPLLIAVPAAGIVGSLMLRKPRLAYEIAGDTLTVRTTSSVTTFPRQTTQASVTSDPLGLRTFGTSLPGYHTGTFTSRSGKVQAAAGSLNPEQALLLEHAGKRYYLTPSDPAAVAAWFGS